MVPHGRSQGGVECPGRGAQRWDLVRATALFQNPAEDGQPDPVRMPGGRKLRPEFAQEAAALEEVGAEPAWELPSN